MSFKKTFFKNLIVAGGYSYLTQLLTFLGSIASSRLLLPGDFGLVALIMVFSGFISIFSDSGISMAVVRSDYGSTYYTGLNGLSIIIGIFLCAAALSIVYPISLFYTNKALVRPFIVISFLFIVRSINIVPIAVLQKRLDFRWIGVSIVSGTVCGIIATIVLAYFGMGFWSLIYSQFLASIVTYLFVRRKVYVKIGRTKNALLLKTYKLTKKLIGSIVGFNLINYWARNFDNLLVGKLYGTSDLGIYNRAYLMLTTPITLITGIFSTVLFPSLVEHKKSGGDIRAEYLFVLKVISLINIPIAVLLILCPDWLVRTLWGHNWIRVAPLLPYFGLLVMTQTLLSSVGNILVLEKREKSMMYSGWIGAVFMISGITIGAFISLEDVASFYSLAFIALVLPFNVIYIFKFELDFCNKVLVAFWVPKIFISFFIWLSIYELWGRMLIVSLILWIIMVFFDVRNEMGRTYAVFYQRIKRY